MAMRDSMEQKESIRAAKEEIIAAMPEGGLTSVVKSVQRGVIHLSTTDKKKTATISAVNLDKAVCHFLGCANDLADTADDGHKFAYIALTGETTVTATRLDAYLSGNGCNVYVSFEVVEYY